MPNNIPIVSEEAASTRQAQTRATQAPSTPMGYPPLINVPLAQHVQHPENPALGASAAQRISDLFVIRWEKFGTQTILYAIVILSLLDVAASIVVWNVATLNTWDDEAVVVVWMGASVGVLIVILIINSHRSSQIAESEGMIYNEWYELGNTNDGIRTPPRAHVAARQGAEPTTAPLRESVGRPLPPS
ncbi:uncharacterized protein F4822DRAFT_430845 [Hypoxylon trugodes]|uniref:uncharacterized protein n=1 Tax=Hypoxylon trugodes TaxID=326681 RepID=UPI0021940B09|nr:uncharacterized protein F4822DRAFT_430845 [Hypoxylon trugodes]KAI1388091.1 hypothetical protein F4822DRAFT_430845 [Hypoxylon trugodes]